MLLRAAHGDLSSIRVVLAVAFGGLPVFVWLAGDPATVLLVGASVPLTWVAPERLGPPAWLTLAVVLGLAGVSLRGSGRTPFRGASR